eukprot:CAMPEP_0177301382 /NCGR_PEP_ID=MMETSP0368-20130122/5033_1 /TAXON_ID=447022 ORGANISM="Scrippsiella hangoei-like, Strain SHHI-4" /NCGR_SAMPLE_ID=MMETSP0368 /ASSEMBLY_ACC=CAM_ASM_000363 /LENGTH=190 /DNA_ID=CAMNT_0018759785 /DNA_START=164 /DNA_END=734 /DNA_ORIENTATION=+
MRHSQGISLPEQLSLWLSDDSCEFSSSLPRPGLPKRGIPERSRRVAFANTALPGQEQPSNRPIVSNTVVTDPGYEHRRHISGAFVLDIVARVSLTKFRMLRDRQQFCELVANLPTSGTATDDASTGATNGRPVHPREAVQELLEETNLQPHSFTDVLDDNGPRRFSFVEPSWPSGFATAARWPGCPIGPS